jgi:EAL domain-containing protein (putative c-di-GMP-specific phosphodiesterase class I)
MYNSELRAAVLNLRKVTTRLRRCVPKMKGFSLVYQPQVDRKGRVVAAEALLRWDPQCGHAVGPNVFVPALEQADLIAPVGRWVIEQALAQLVAFRATGIALRHIGVNVSARQLQPDFVDFVQRATAAAGLKPKDLVLELTESQAVADSGRFADTIRALAAAGFAWEIDDFAAGYASMRWLRTLEFRGLKIDRSVLINPKEPPKMIYAICVMAKVLELRTTCEGVETKEQWDRVIKSGVHRVQGFLVGRPVPAAEFVAACSAPEPPTPSARRPTRGHSEGAHRCK